ncbi:oligopeptidase A [Deinobacterium chartae]|uniref:oligopeptidase A n=1 Tax=Deinobacterium chartae TaxID=521158 RepID=A0A841HU75_9DEIO|nr:M3 family metallopeptidase [Deinobacterium chartae]MBB6096991.1 oligopeptidase A [Deinobacterium chartae]
MSITVDNPLMRIRNPIPFDQIRPEHVEPAIDALIARARADLEMLAAHPGPRTFENTLGELDRLTETLGYAMNIVGHLEGVATSPELRAAYNAVLPKYSAFVTDLVLHEGLYAALKEYAATEEARGLTGARARFLHKTLEDFRREGAELSPEGKARLKEIELRLSELTTRYAENVLDSTGAFELLLPDAERLRGLPQSALEAARASARSRGYDGYRLTLHAPSYIPAITYLEDAELRRELYLAYFSRGTEPERDNRPIIAEVLALRAEKARLLGYANFADLVLADRMAGNGERAFAFEREMTEQIRPFFERENAELRAFRRELEGEDAPELEPWDVSYYAEKQRQARYDFDDEALRPYFPLPGVLEGLFEITRRVFGVTVREREGVPGWHEDVRFYDIFDAQDVHIASFYTDWFPRDTKRGGAWMNNLVTGDRSNGRREPHLALMCGNMTMPVGDRPALLTHDEVETVFHEFGHLLHHALTEVEVKSLAGANVAWDFVELPSQIMENWTWEREALDLFARHYETGEPIPQDLFERLISARNYRAANAAMRQLSFGTVDLAMHVEYDPARDGDVMDYARGILGQFAVTPVRPDNNFIAAFTHIFGDAVGYAAGYYSYKWAEVLDADAFTRFREEGIFNARTGSDFVRAVLSRGNSEDPAQLYREFMGRDPEPKALLARSGLLAETV